MLTRPVRLEAKEEKLSSKWHSIRGRYVALFDPVHVQHVERWYNTIAPNRHRENFRAVMKHILQSAGGAQESLADSLAAGRTTSGGNKEELERCKAENILRIYGGPLSADGRRHVLHWLLHVANPAQIDAFRDIFTGVCSLFNQERQMKHAFKYRPLPDIAVKRGGAPELGARAESAPTTAGVTGPSTSHRPSRAQALSAATSAADEKIAELKEKRKQYMQSNKYQVDPQTGCSVFRAVTGSPRRETNSKHRVMATFQADDTHNWISTTRDLLRNYGSKPLLEAERVRPEEHPAIALTTASVGLCVPSAPESFRRTLAHAK